MTRNPQKLLPGRYVVVPRSIIFIINDGKVLLQKGSETKKIYAGYYNGIGGHIERGETPLDGAYRELKEESGLVCEDLRLCGTIHIDVTPEQGILLFVFAGTKVSGNVTDSNEGKLFWIGLENIKGLKLVEDVPELVSNSLKSINENAQFFGVYTYDETGTRKVQLHWDQSSMR
jgi:8-oxo-dGTP diphosphatase